LTKNATFVAAGSALPPSEAAISEIERNSTRRSFFEGGKPHRRHKSPSAGVDCVDHDRATADQFRSGRG